MRDRPDRRNLLLLRARGIRCADEEEQLLLVETSILECERRSPWPSIVGLSIDQLVAWGVLYYAFNVLAAPMALDFGVSRRFVAGAFSLALLVAGVLAGRVGRVLDRYGARTVLVVGGVTGALAFAALAFVHEAWTLLVVFALLGATHALSLYEPAFRAVVDWMVEERPRARALLLLTSVAGFASTAFLPLTARWVEAFGWRTSVLLLAAVLVAVVLPMRLAMPPPTGSTAQRAPQSVLTPSRAADLLGIAFALQSFASTGIVVFLVWHFVERGMSVEAAATLAGLVGAAQAPGRLLLLPLQRALRPEQRLPALFVLQALGLTGIAYVDGAPRVLSILLFGGTAGMMTLERAMVTVEWFGRETFGARSGRMAAMAAVARAASPFAVESLHGVMTYARTIVAMTLVFLAGAGTVLMATRARAGIQRSGGP